jgi:hypothetical protein
VVVGLGLNGERVEAGRRGLVVAGRKIIYM